jgi:hypothetical protein
MSGPGCDSPAVRLRYELVGKLDDKPPVACIVVNDRPVDVFAEWMETRR